MNDRAEPTLRGSPRSHGQMTAVMRAAQRRAEPRVLRAALVRGGQVIDERVLPRGAHLTVGPSEHNTFVIAELPASLRLVEHGPEGYRLHVARGVGGRVAKGAAIHDLATVGGDGTLALNDEARGKIAIGGCLVLFHFVEPPVKPPRAQLPIAVRKGALGDLDWKTTCIAAFSFLCHFGALGAIYSDWADPVADDDDRVARTIQIVKELPPAPPPIEQKPTDADTAASAKPSDAAQPPAAARAVGRSSAPGPSRGAAGSERRMTETQAHQIARDLEAMNAAMLLEIGARTGGATARVLAGGDMPMGMLNNVAAAPGGARPGDVAGLNLRGDGGGVVRPGAVAGGGLPGADVKADARQAESGKAVEVKKPVGGRADTQPPTVSGGNVADAGKVVAGMRGQLRACYKRALEEDPTMRGSVRVTASIAPNGEVRSAQPAASGLSSNMVACVTRVVRGALFSAPDGGGATVVIPMTFIPQ